MNRYESESLFASNEPEKVQGGHIIRVALESAAVDNEYDYLAADDFWPIRVGQRVEVPFGRGDRPESGFCVEAGEEFEDSFSSSDAGHRLKRILAVTSAEPLVDDELMKLARWISGYYVCPLGQVLAAMVPAAVKKGAGVRSQKCVYLAEGWEDAAKTITGAKQKQIAGYLRDRGAFDIDRAVELPQVLEEALCTMEPVKRLAERLVVKFSQREVIKSNLLAIPAGCAAARPEKVELNADQRNALDEISGRVDAGEFGVTLLHGVTDSGKTEIYIRAIEHAISRGKRAIVLLPEIALTAQTVQRFSSRFAKIAVMHSALTAAQRNVQWQKIRAGEADVVIGARSAIFAPLENCGLIVVDEEHEPSYKQDTSPRYNGRDVAIKRAQIAKAHCILGSATPSLETISNCKEKGYYRLVRLTRRVMDLPMPEMKLVDMRQWYTTDRGLSLISKPLEEKLREILAKGEQAILLLNRRGYSSFVMCPGCKHILRCRNCDVSLTFHSSAGQKERQIQTFRGKHINHGHSICHYCGAQSLVPEQCVFCGRKMIMAGYGSQRLEEELAEKFPDAKVARIDSDSMAGRDYYALLKDFGDGKINILAGTQMLAKGLHFPNVTVVGIISADTSLQVPDFRANERTFQLISQVAGRTGRSEKKGMVFVQTFLAEQPAIQFALKGDFEGFLQAELKQRQECNLPPFWRLAVVVLRDMNFDKLYGVCKQMREQIDFIVQRENLHAMVRGPVPAGISMIQRYHRMQIVIQTPNAPAMLRLFSSLRAMKPLRPAVKTAIDIDPVNLM